MRIGEPVSFGTLESWRRQLAEELLSNPSPALQRLHDDLAEALQAVAESNGVGREFFEALQSQQLAQVLSRGLDPYRVTRDTLKVERLLWTHAPFLAVLFVTAVLLEKYGDRERLYQAVWTQPGAPVVANNQDERSPFSVLVARLDSFDRLFERLFRPSVGWKPYLLRSSLATLISVFALSLAHVWYGLVRGADFGESMELFLRSPITMLAWIPVALIPCIAFDHLSLRQTHRFLRIARDMRSPLASAIAVILDLLATILIAAMSAWLLSVLIQYCYQAFEAITSGRAKIPTLTHHESWDAFMRSISAHGKWHEVFIGSIAYYTDPDAAIQTLGSAHHPPDELVFADSFPTLCSLFYSGFLTSIWLWLYLIGATVRSALLRYINRTERLRRRFLKAKESPLVTLWFVLAPIYLIGLGLWKFGEWLI